MYRLQLTPDFGFAEAAEIGEYLANLGVTHVYLSPVLEAVPGSLHGYDVTDHSRIRGELGGEEGFRAMAKRLRGFGLGIVLDIVPNHMAVPDNLALNRQLWSVLRDGRASPLRGLVRHRLDRARRPDAAAGTRRPAGVGPRRPSGGAGRRAGRRADAQVLRPRAAAAAGDGAAADARLLESQHYLLAWWRDAATELNWRRFFNVSSLIGVRVEVPAVFDATHEVIVRLVAEGLVDGLRIDHPDGLADPRGYLARLASATDGAWVVVEKILETGETLPADWACAGTTGYDGLKLIDGLFLDPAGADPLTAEYARFVGLPGRRPGRPRGSPTSPSRPSGRSPPGRWRPR